MRHHILLIESDEPLHEAVVRHLKGLRVTAYRSQAEAESALEHARDHALAPRLIVADASCMSFYLKARQRFPGLRWVLSETDASDLNGAHDRDRTPYDASIEQPDVEFPSDTLH